MEAYKLSLTGQEIEEILKSAQEAVLTFSNVSVEAAAWVSSGDSDFPYQADITCTGVTTNHVPNVIFGSAQATSGNYSSVVNTPSDGVVRIYSKVTDTITIPTIQCIKSI